MDIAATQAAVYMTASDHGWWDTEDDCNVPTKLALIHSEVSEALEAFREGKMELYYQWRDPETGKLVRLTPTLMADKRKEHPEFGVADFKPCGFGSELADVLIRVWDLAEWLSIDTNEEVRIKMAYNETRAPRHGGKKV